MLTVSRIYRFPVKGLTPEALDRVALRVGQGLPGDRRFALAHGSTQFDPAAPEWMPKTNFLMLMKNERLAGLRTDFDSNTETLTIRENGTIAVQADLRHAAGRSAVERFFAVYMGSEVDGTPKLVEALGHMFSDNARKIASIIGLASVRLLEATLRHPVDERRFRANFYFDGGQPWQELDWIGREITIGRVRLRGFKAIRRCAATNVDPETGRRDLNIPHTLQRVYGHVNMGVHAEVLEAGTVSIGDPIAVAG